MTPLRRHDRGAKASSGTSRATLAELPHERDESPQGVIVTPTTEMRQAADDLERGRVDTECRGATPARECERELPALLKPAPPEAVRRREPRE